jgi:hypothetical protein
VIIPTSFIVQYGSPNNNQNTTNPNADDLLGWLKKGVESFKQMPETKNEWQAILQLAIIGISI